MSQQKFLLVGQKFMDQIILCLKLAYYENLSLCFQFCLNYIGLFRSISPS